MEWIRWDYQLLYKQTKTWYRAVSGVACQSQSTTLAIIIIKSALNSTYWKMRWPVFTWLTWVVKFDEWNKVLVSTNEMRENRYSDDTKQILLEKVLSHSIGVVWKAFKTFVCQVVARINIRKWSRWPIYWTSIILSSLRTCFGQEFLW